MSITEKISLEGTRKNWYTFFIPTEKAAEISRHCNIAGIWNIKEEVENGCAMLQIFTTETDNQAINNFLC